MTSKHHKVPDGNQNCAKRCFEPSPECVQWHTTVAQSRQQTAPTKCEISLLNWRLYSWQLEASTQCGLQLNTTSDIFYSRVPVDI